MKLTLFATALACLSKQRVLADVITGNPFASTLGNNDPSPSPVTDLGCDTYKYFAKFSDLREPTKRYKSWDENTSSERPGDKENLLVPLYNAKGEEVGAFAQSLEYLPGNDDCIGAEIMTITNKQGVQKGQVSIALTCQGVNNPITGGTGMFSCASGTLDFEVDEAKEQTGVILQVCGSCSEP